MTSSDSFESREPTDAVSSPSRGSHDTIIRDRNDSQLEKATAIAEDLAEQLTEKDTLIVQLTERVAELESYRGLEKLDA